jgi:thioredoxin reductase
MRVHQETIMFDVVIIGGGAAGLSAALTLGRFRRSVLVCDSQRPRNAPSSGVHGFLSRDGMPPKELLQIARDQLAPYTTVELRTQEVIDLVQADGHFELTLQDGSTASARKVLFASGVKDVLPAIEGIEALWGRGVFHCPYCHGWEARDKQIAILADGEGALHIGKLLRALSNDIVICTNGTSTINSDERDQLERVGIRLIETPIARLDEQDSTLQGIHFTDGSYLAREAIFVRTTLQQHSSLPAKLGCAMTDAGFVAVDEMNKTSIDGVFAAGDLSSPMQQVIHAASRGAVAAAWINTALAQESFMRDAADTSVRNARTAI